MPSSSKKINPIIVLEECQLDDNAPLFYSPGKRGFYSPRQGYPSYERLNAFRNVGRYVFSSLETCLFGRLILFFQTRWIVLTTK